MSVRSSLRVFPALLRVGTLEAFAYRGEMLVWVLTTTMPLIMLALFGAVAREGPLGRYGQPQLAAYFLATFIVRQLTGSWVSWQINWEVRDGTLSARLLRPVHPILSYAAEAVATIPMRTAVSIPVAVTILAVVGSSAFSHDPVIWALWFLSILGSWLLSFTVSLAIGALAFFIESSTKLMDVWLALFFVFSGYLVPIDLFPEGVRRAIELMPFRYQIGLPVELMTGAHDRATALSLLLHQWEYVALFAVITWFLWRKGVARFAAYGG